MRASAGPPARATDDGDLDAAPPPAPAKLLGVAFWRFQAALFLLGALVGVVFAMHEPTGTRRSFLLVLAAVHLGAGVVVRSRAGRGHDEVADSRLLPAVFLCTAIMQGTTASQPAAFATLSILGFVWVGTTAPRWTSLRLSPLIAGGCSLIVWSHDVTVPVLVDAAIGVVVAVVAGEVLSWVMARLLAADATVRAQDARFRALVQKASDIIVVCDADTRVTYQSPSVSEVLGYAPDDLIGTKLTELTHDQDREVLTCSVVDLLDRPGSGQVTATLRWRRPDGSWCHVAAVLTNLLDDPDVGGLVVNGHDVTERVRLEDELTRQAFNDSLTGLANRALLADRLSHLVAGAERRSGPVAVLLFDLDDFKRVNDTLGHHAGDQVLTTTGARLLAIVRGADTVARLGGDEFAVLLDEFCGPDDVLQAAARALSAVAEPMTIEGTEVMMSASVGIAIRHASERPEELLRNADVAMYAAKRGGGGAALFEDSMHAQLATRLAIESDLRRALERHEFDLHYQPVVDLRSMRVVGAEALVRWRHPERGLLLPGAFVAIAEQTGLIVPLGRWVLGEACRQTKAWGVSPGVDDPFTVAVNVSARQLRESEFAASVMTMLANIGLPPHALILEITESVMMQEDSRDTLAGLRRLGIRVAIDDFGTGYSSLSYLQRLPVDLLKIDKSFVDAVATSPEADSVVRAIVDLGAALQLETVAEGIEDADQLEALRSLGTQLGQGYHFARPLTAPSFGRLLRHPSSLPGGELTGRSR